MEINKFIKSYQEQLIKAGVEPIKAEIASKNLDRDKLRIISEIWSDWALVYTMLEANLPESNPMAK